MESSHQRPGRRSGALSLVIFPLLLVVTLSSEGQAARKASKPSSGVPTDSPASAGLLRQQPPPAKPMPSARRLPAAGKTGFGARPKKSASVEPLSTGTTRRPLKASRKPAAKAVLQPRTDLIPYGMLEDSQRYDPRPRAMSGGVPSPQRLDLTHEHFQELDRNQDGKIDPVERAFGRIDMDRDLQIPVQR